MKPYIVHIPFLGTDEETVAKQLARAPIICPGYTKYEYKEPRWVEFIFQGRDESYWTFPEIEATNPL